MATHSIPTGRLDRIVRLQSKTVTRDSFGGTIENWVDLAEVWASVRQTASSEKFAKESNRVLPLRKVTIRIRWRDDVRETSRVVYDGFLWDIKGRGEIGFRRFLDLFCVTDTSRRVPVETPGRERREVEVWVEEDRKPVSESLPKPGEAEKP